jgi:hydrogenase maturation protease
LKNALIIGLGDILCGDQGVGCYLLEELAQEPLSASVQFVYLGDDPRCAGGLIYAADMVIIVGALHLAGSAGRLHTWTYEVFRQHMDWMANEFQPIRFLVQALARAELAGGFPKDLSFLWMEPKATEGFGLSSQMRKAMWKATRSIKQKLFENGLLPEKALTVSPMFHIKPLGKAACSS